MGTENEASETLRGRLEALGWSKADIEDAFEIAAEYQTQPDVAKVWIYGSMARGTFDKKGKQSDMDISVEKDNLPTAQWRGDKRVGRDGRPIQIQIFQAGYDEKTAEGSKYEANRRFAMDARQRLNDQIVIWQRPLENQLAGSR